LVNRNTENNQRCEFNGLENQALFETRAQVVQQHNNLQQTLQRSTRNARDLQYSIDDEVMKTVRVINDHAPEPFKQTESFFAAENVTKIEVEAHLHYPQNTIYKEHLKGIVVAVVEDSCIFIDDPDTEGEESSEMVSVGNDLPINKKNTKDVGLPHSYVPSDVNLKHFSTLVQESCQNKKLLEQGYDLREYHQQSTNGTFSIEMDTLEEQYKPLVHESKRLRRSNSERVYGNVYCRTSLCGGTSAQKMVAQCTNSDCNRNRWCYYIPSSDNEGTTVHPGRRMTHFTHFYNSQYFCMPCCLFSSKSRKMPMCDKITMKSKFCRWLDKYGRCTKKW